MRSSAEDAPFLSGSRWRGRDDLDAVPGRNDPIRKDKHASLRLRTSPMVASMISSTSTSRRPRLHQHYIHPPSKPRGIFSVGNHGHGSDSGFVPVARDTYYGDRQVKAANRSHPRGGTSAAPGSAAPRSNIGRNRDSPKGSGPYGKKHEYCSSVIDLEEPASRALRRPWPNAIRSGNPLAVHSTHCVSAASAI